MTEIVSFLFLGCLSVLAYSGGIDFLGVEHKLPQCLFDSRIIRRMICESMLSTKIQKLLKHCCLGEPDCLAGIMLPF